jgi:C-terminal processing protease CtpA/Prc
MGAIDYLDYYPMELPSGKYKLYMPTSKRVIPPGEQPIDGKGIYPDIQIADSELDWANYVHQYYKNQR